MASGEKPLAIRPQGSGTAPGPGLLAACLAVGLGTLAVVLWAGPLLPWARPYFLKLPLPVLVTEVALAFAVLALPAFRADAGGGFGPALAGAARGAALTALVLPALLASRAACPLSGWTVLACAGLLAVTACGAAAAGAAFGPRGLALAAGATMLPGLFGFLAVDVLPPAVWLSGLSPFVAAARAGAGQGGWWSGALPGLALLAASLAALTRRD